MKLRTEVEIGSFEAKIGFESRIFTVGSCFAQRIGQEMSRVKLSAVVNPVGTLFNPLSICGAIERLCERRYITESEVCRGVGSQPAWYHPDFHSSLSRGTLCETMEAINGAIEVGHSALESSDWVVITLGTAWIYEDCVSGSVVANCHKRPMREFVRRRLSVEEVLEAMSRCVEGALSGKRVVVTVSPIRHIGDGLIENSLSKSILRVAAAELEQRFERVRYFPSFEILMDDLRDYRFYDRDMVHLSPVAVDYVWDRFSNAALSGRAKELMPKVMQIIKAAEHRPIDPSSDSHQKFVRSQIRAIETLQNEVNLEREMAIFVGQII